MDSAQEVLSSMGVPIDFEEIYFSEVNCFISIISSNQNYKLILYILHTAKALFTNNKNGPNMFSWTNSFEHLY